MCETVSSSVYLKYFISLDSPQFIQIALVRHDSDPAHLKCSLISDAPSHKFQACNVFGVSQTMQYRAPQYNMKVFFQEDYMAVLRLCSVFSSHETRFSGLQRCLWQDSTCVPREASFSSLLCRLELRGCNIRKCSSVCGDLDLSPRAPQRPLHQESVLETFRRR